MASLEMLGYYTTTDSEMPLEEAISILKARKDYQDGGEL